MFEIGNRRVDSQQDHKVCKIARTLAGIRAVRYVVEAARGAKAGHEAKSRSKTRRH